ncbi:MAG: DNA-binding protein [Chloroflexota bacterium]|nr:DNA-binding protein [Chloroflexota bacterium]
MTNDRGDSEFAGIVSRPAQRALEAAGYSRLEELPHVSEKELLALHGFGPKGIRMLNAELAKRNQAVGSARHAENQ